LKFKFFTALYDGWMGYYYDRDKKILYIGFPFWCMWSFASDDNYWDAEHKKWIRISGLEGLEHDLEQST
jgi:hypothetical protein